MTVEQKVLLQLLSAVIGEKEPVSVTSVTDWSALMKEAYAQGVFLLIFDRLSALPQALEPAKRCTAHNLRVECTQDLLVQVLQEGGYPYVILKGEAAAAYYPQPELRLLGDVDFLVQDGHRDAVIAAMQALGFSVNGDIQPYHQALIRGAEQAELHVEVAGIPQGEKGAAVRRYLAAVLEKRQLCQQGGRNFYVPSPEHHGMILLLHMQHHMQSHGLGLRHLMDWACFVQRTAQDAFWQQSLLPVLEEIGLGYYSKVMTKMCALFLGIQCPGWAESAPSDLCRELMEDFLDGGNFGRKDQTRARGTNMLPDWTVGDIPKSKVVLLWRTLRQAVVKQHPDCEKRPVLRLWYMTGKVLRYCALFCAGKRPNIWRAAVSADRRRRIYDQLKMFQ